MKKNFLFMIALFLSALSFGSNAYAFSGGLLNGKSMYLGKSLTDPNPTLITSITDGLNATALDFKYPYAVWYNFSSAATINAYQVADNYGGWEKLYFFDKNGVQIGSAISVNPYRVIRSITPVSGVYKVAFVNVSGGDTIGLYDLDVYGWMDYSHDEISSLSISNDLNSSKLSWTDVSNPTNLDHYTIYRNGTPLTTTNSNSYIDNALSPKTNYSYKVSAVYKDGFETVGLTQSITTGIPHNEISNLNATMTYNSAYLYWSLPDNPYLVGFKVYKDNTLLQTLDNNTTTFKDTGLSENSPHTYRVTALYYDGAETQGLSKTVTTPFDPIIKDVLSAKINPVSYKQINLSWTLPTQSRFKDVSIYRDEKPKKQGFFSSLVSGTIVFAAAQTEIFQTNGTYFNDLTVKPDTSYEYTLKTETTVGSTSDGVTLTADTPAEPIPIYTPDGEYSPTTNGDYLFKWTTPTTGNVKVLVGGKDYQTVPSSLKQITIPKSDMKYTVMGDPNVKMTPIGEFGTEGKIVYVGGNSLSNLPISVADLLGSANGLLWILAPFLLLALSFLLFPKFRKLIFSAFGKQKDTKKGTEKGDSQERKSKTGERKSQGGNEPLEKKELQAKKEAALVKKPRTTRTIDKKETNGKGEKQPRKSTRKPTRKATRKPRSKSEKELKTKRAARKPREKQQPKERSTRKQREPRRRRGAS